MVILKLDPISLGSRDLIYQRPFLKGKDVRHLQQLLKYMGFYHGRVDGVFGWETQYAIRKYQKAFGKKTSKTITKKELKIVKHMKQSTLHQWKSPQKDFQNTGYFPVSFPDKLKEIWRKPLLGILGFVIKNDILVVTTEEGIYAYRTSNFKLIWSKKRIYPKAAASLGNDKIILLTENLKIIDIKTGKSTTVKGDFSQPAAFKDNSVYIPTYDGLQALDEKGPLWQKTTTSILYATPVLGKNHIYFSTHDKYIYCLNKKGILYWKQRLPSIVEKPLTLWEDKIFAVSIDGWFYALDSIEGNILWEKKFSDEKYFPPAFVEKEAIIVDATGSLLSINVYDGKLNWAKDIGDTATTAPITTPNKIYIGTKTGLYILHRKTQEELRLLAGEEVKTIAMAGIKVFVGTKESLIILSLD